MHGPATAEWDQNGFTLIELMIVIVVLGILSAVIVLGLSTLTRQALTSACRADAQTVAIAQVTYRAQNPTSTFAPDLPTLMTSKYLRSAPGNTSHYVVITDRTGVVMITNIRTTATKSYDGDPTICDAL